MRYNIDVKENIGIDLLRIHYHSYYDRNNSSGV